MFPYDFYPQKKHSVLCNVAKNTSVDSCQNLDGRLAHQNTPCKYHFGNYNDYDVNKLWGITFGVNPLKNSIRFGWNCEDNDGKILYGYLLNELRGMRRDRDDLVDIVVKYILEHEAGNIEALSTYLKGKIDS